MTDKTFNKDECTKGRGEAFIYADDDMEIVVDDNAVADVYVMLDDEGEANAHLMAQAFTTLHETGLTPAELSEQYTEVVDALRDIVLRAALCDVYLDGVTRSDGLLIKDLDQARAIIAKATGGTP